MQHRCSGWIERARYLLEEALQTAPDGDAGYDAAALEDRILLSATPIVQAVADGGLDTAVDAPLTFAPEAQTAVVQRRELVIIDPAAGDYQQLVDSLNARDERQMEVLVLDGAQDGVQQISAFLADHHDMDAIHIVSHADEGAVKLGNVWLSESNLAGYAGAIANWQTALASDADILFYGCELAGNQAGRELVQSLSGLTGADVAASIDDTGHASLGGDWEFEYTVGVVETEGVFGGDVQQHWMHLLATTETHYFLVGNGIPDASLETPIPTSSSVQDYDSGRHSGAGTMVAKGGSGSGETDPVKHQAWTTTSGSISIDGQVSLSLWSASKDFNDNKGATVHAYLIDVQQDGSDPQVIATDSVTRGVWSSSGDWVEDTFDFGTITRSLGSTRRLQVKIVVAGDSDNDMLFAYDDVFHRSHLQVGTTTSNADPSLKPGGGALSYTENDAATAIAPSLTMSDDDANMQWAVVQITDNHASGEDVLSFSGPVPGGLTMNYDSNTGQMVFRGTSSVANYQTALQGVRYANSSDNPNTNARTVTFSIYDGQNLSTATRKVNVLPVNDAPTAASTATDTGREDQNAVYTHAQMLTLIGGADVDNGSADLDIDITNVVNATLNRSGSGNATTYTFNLTQPTHTHGYAITFDYELTDSEPLSSGVGSATINVLAVNDEPALTIGSDQNVLEDTGAHEVLLFASATPGGGADESGQTFTYIVNNSNGSLFSVAPAIDASGKLTYTLAPHAVGTATVTVSARDSGGTANGGDNRSPNQQFDINVAPTASAGIVATSEFRANTNTSNTQETSLEGRGSQQAVAMDADGDYVVVWSSLNQDGSGWGIYGQLYDKDGVARGGELHINSGDTAFDQKWATVGMDAAGNFVVAWTDFGTLGDSHIVARQFDADGNALGGIFQVNDTSIYNRSSPSIAVADDGRFVIAWKGGDALTDVDIFARRFDATGAALDAGDIVVEGAAGGDGNAAVAINNSGEFAVLWDDAGGVKVQRFNADGTTNGGRITVDGSGNAGNGSLAMHSDGSLVVAWREDTSGSHDVHVRRYDNTGIAEGLATTVSISTADDQTDPSISMASDGSYVIVWEGTGDQAGHSDTSGVFGQKYDATGAKVGDEFRINQSTGGSQHLASVAMLNLDNFVAVWSGNGKQSNQTDSSGVFARQFGTGTLPTGQLWFTAAGTGDGGGETWTDSEILQFGDTGDTFDLNAGTTSGTVSKLPGFVAPYDVRAMHYVESSVTLGTTGTQFTVQQGDLLLTFDPGGTGTAGGVTVDRLDIVVFRPDTAADYSSGTYTMLIDGDSGDATSGVHDATKAYNVHGISLVERDTVVGGTTLTKGTLLVAHSDTSLHHNIYTMNVIGTGVGASTETSEVELLLSGQALGLDGQPTDPYQLQGLHLVQQTTSFSGTTVAAGTLMVVVEGSDAYAGQVLDQFDVVALTVTQTEQDTVAGTAATGKLLFDGTDLTINNPAGESLSGFTIVSSSSLGANQTPTADAGGAYAINEGEGLVLSAAGSSDPEGDTLTYNWDLDNDGLFGEVGEPTGVGATVSWASLQSFGIDDDGTYTIGVQVDDSHGGTHSATTTLTVNEVAPVLNVGGTTAGTEDAVYSLTLSATDAGNDTIMQWTVDWGDGTTTTHNFDSGTATHTYTVGGNFSILVAATDEDGQYVDRDLLVAAHVTGQDDVYRFDAATGELVSNLASSGGELQKPVQALLGPNGDIYVTGFDSDNVVRYDSAGNYLGEFVSSGSGGLDGASGLVFDNDGNLYVASSLSTEILRYDSSGNFQGVFGTSGEGLNGASGIVFGPDGDLYVTAWSNGKVYKYHGTNGGSPTVVIGSGLSNPDQIVFNGDGELLIANGPNNTVKIYDGSLTTFASGMDNATGIALSPEGILYVSNRNANSITMFDATSGASLGTLVASGTAGLSNPYHISWIPDHQVQVAHVADTPTVTDSSTNQETQTTTGLVISRNPADTAAVTHYKITNIADGVLYLNDGSTQINNGDFITVAQGAAGLKFTPGSGFSGAASFDVQASLADNNGGLGGGIATANISVTAATNTPATVALNNLVSPINENTSTGGGLKVADIVITDDGNGTNTLGLSGADASAFEIDGLELKLKDSVTLDYESKFSYDVTVTVDDAGIPGSPDNTGSVTILIQDVDEFDVGAISDANATSNAVDEDAAVGAAVGVTASATDADATNNTVSYSLDDDAGGRFTIDSTTGVVSVDGTLDAETATSHTIVVRATSSDTSTTTQSFTINVNDVNESNVSLIADSDGNANAVAENAASGTTVGLTASATDADVTNNTVSYTLTNDADGRFTIDATTGVVTVNGTLDAEVDDEHTIVVRAFSSDGSFKTQAFKIAVTNVNDNLPVFTSSDRASVNENLTVVHTLTATDADVPAQTISFVLSGGDDISRFAINASNQLVFLVAPNFEAPSDSNADNVYEVEVTAHDGAGGSTTQAIAVTVHDDNEVPSITAVSDQTLDEDQSSGPLTFTIGDLETTASGLLVTASSSNPAVVGSRGITLGGSGAQRTITVMPEANQSGSSVMTITVSDGTLTADTSFVVTVTSVNDVAVGRADRIVVLNDSVTFSAADLMANDYDVDGDALTLQIVSPPEHGTLIDLGGGRFEFQPADNGDTFMTYRLFDGSVYSDPVTVRFVVPQVPVTPAALPARYEAPAEVSSEPSEPSQETDSQEPQDESTAEEPTVTEVPVVPEAAPQTVLPAAIDVAAGLPDELQNPSQTLTWTLRSENLVDAVVEVTDRVLGDDVVSDNREEIKAAYATAAAQIHDAITQPQMWQALHSMQDQIDSSVSTTTLTMGATVTATTSITVGYVVWVIRGGILLSSVMANLPMWRLMDPMAILNAVDGAEEDDETLESMVDEQPPAEPLGADV